MPQDFTADLNKVTTAPLIRRLMAMVYDTLLVAAIWMMIGGIAVSLNGGEAVDSGLGQAALKSVLLCSTFLFFGICWTKSGQTLGMLAWRLRIQNHAGTRISWQQSLFRFFGGLVSLLCLGLGFWVMLFSDEKLTWHDRWSNSVVVMTPERKRKSD